MFWAVCIPLRTGIARVATSDLYLLRGVAAAIGARWLGGWEVGHEGVFGGPAWWADERPVHGAMWTGYALSGDSKFLYLDTLYGAYNWLSTPQIS